MPLSNMTGTVVSEANKVVLVLWKPSVPSSLLSLIALFRSALVFLLKNRTFTSDWVLSFSCAFCSSKQVVNDVGVGLILIACYTALHAAYRQPGQAWTGRAAHTPDESSPLMSLPQEHHGLPPLLLSAFTTSRSF